MTFSRIISLAMAMLMLLCILTSCGVAKPEYAYDDEAPSLSEAYSDYFKIGAAINSWDLDESSDSFKIINRQYDTYVMENETKPDQIHPSEDTYNFGATDKFVEFGEKYGKTLRGHTLVWHSQCPNWFFEDNGETASADLLIERMKDHITTVVSRYKGKIDTWDVCNEVLDDSFGLRLSSWLKIVGDYDGDGDKYDFIEIAFRTAHEADPDARLIINDYSLESSTDKAITMYNMVKKMLSEGVPVDGVGLQMHVGIDTDVEKARENMKILAKLKEIDPDFILEVTELDMSCYTWGDNSTEIDFKKVEKQFNEKYKELFNMFMDLSEEGILDSVVFWGYNDGMSWLNGYPVQGRTNHPLLIDRDLKFKSAYWALLDLPKKR